MKTIYLNANFECSVTQKTDTIQTIATEAFDGKCNAFIEGYRFVPSGKTWTRNDGEVFSGEMITPFKNSQMLETAQASYDEAIAILQPQIDTTQLAIAELYESGVQANG